MSPLKICSGRYILRELPIFSAAIFIDDIFMIADLPMNPEALLYFCLCGSRVLQKVSVKNESFS